MKKFSNINESKKVEKVDIFESKVEDMISSLDVDIEGIDEPWKKNISIKANEEFKSKLKDLVNLTYLKEKSSFLDKAKKSQFTRDMSWIEEEISLMNESMKKFK